MSFLRLVGGTECGDREAPAVWNDRTSGAPRVLRAALNVDICDVVVIGRGRDGQAYVASSMAAEAALGLVERTRVCLVAAANYEAAEQLSPPPPPVAS